MLTELFDYDLPEELIAQTPLPRGQSRLLVLHRSSGGVEHRRFEDLPNYLARGDTIVLNDTRVTGRRLVGRRSNGREAEILLISCVGEVSWKALIRPGRTLKSGSTVTLVGPHSEVDARIESESDDGGRILSLPDQDWRDRIATWGHTPLPPYIRVNLSAAEEDRYQTVYSRIGGSAAAPTAGLHFTQDMLDNIESLGVRSAAITLHVGVGTFRPVRSAEIGDHKMHGEFVSVSQAAVAVINATKNRVVAVGTTSVRALESAANPAINAAVAGGVDTHGESKTYRLKPFSGETDLFIQPGYQFRVVDALLTNFHQPKSTLLMLVSAFAGCEQVKLAYQEAIHERYRFFSFGDAMLIL